METFLKIPKKRIGALIGKNGKTKKLIQKELKCTLNISKDGGVEVTSKDPLSILKAKDIIAAIGRGFSPQNALYLLDDEYILDVINLQELLGKKEKKISRYKSRIIGSEGMAKKRIEEFANTKIEVYGKTVSIIGKRKGIKTAHEAIRMILDGMTHKAVFAFLERKSGGYG